MGKRSISLLLGVLFTSIYAGLVYFTVLLKGSGLEVLFFNTGTILVLIGAALLWLFESIGLISDPGMASGFVMFYLGGCVFWFCVFYFLSLFTISKYVSIGHH